MSRLISLGIPEDYHKCSTSFYRKIPVYWFSGSLCFLCLPQILFWFLSSLVNFYCYTSAYSYSHNESGYRMCEISFPNMGIILLQWLRKGDVFSSPAAPSPRSLAFRKRALPIAGRCGHNCQTLCCVTPKILAAGTREELAPCQCLAAERLCG